MKTQFLILPCMLALLLAAPVYAQAPYADSATTAHEQVPSDGIAVSGAWTLTVYEPDGTLIERREFHNDLHTAGPRRIADALTGSLTSANWVVIVFGVPNMCVNTIGSPSPCYMQPAGGSQVPHIFETLVVDVPTTGPDTDMIVLRGSYTAEFDGSADGVGTFLRKCLSDVAPDDCPTQGALPSVGDGFTQTALDTPLAVQAGQVVQVEVKIGFGTATSAVAGPNPTARAIRN